MLLRSFIVAVFFCVTYADGYACPDSDQIRPCECYKKLESVDITCLNAQTSEVVKVIENLDEKVKNIELKFERVTLIRLPSQLVRGLDLKILKVLNCNLSSVDTDAFADVASTLEELDLSHNNLEIIPSEALEKLYSLKNLYLDSNRLTIIHANAFKGLHSLFFLSLKSNKIHTIENQAFAGIGNKFELFHLDRNELTSVPSESLRNLASLKILVLQSNKIATLRPGGFSVGLVSLEYIDLSKNTIREIPPRAFQSLQKLRNLELSKNAIESVHTYAFQGTGEILEDIQISDNRLTEIPAASFRNLTRMKFLNLGNNIISKVRKHDFTYWGKSLNVVQLENNVLTSVNSKAFVSLKSLLYLNLESNKLNTAPFNTYAPILDTLYRLDMQGNPLYCDCEISWLKDRMKNDKSLYISSADNIKCACPEEYRNIPLAEIQSSRLFCQNSTSKLDEICEFRTFTSNSNYFTSYPLLVILHIFFMCLAHNWFRPRLF